MVGDLTLTGGKDGEVSYEYGNWLRQLRRSPTPCCLTADYRGPDLIHGLLGGHPQCQAVCLTHGLPLSVKIFGDCFPTKFFFKYKKKKNRTIIM